VKKKEGEREEGKEGNNKKMNIFLWSFSITII
jgi:hypothetical protein